MTAPRHHQKTKKRVGAQFLEISTPSQKQLEQSSHLLAYEITQPIKTNQATFRGPHTHPPQCYRENCSPYSIVELLESDNISGNLSNKDATQEVETSTV